MGSSIDVNKTSLCPVPTLVPKPGYSTVQDFRHNVKYGNDLIFTDTTVRQNLAKF